jgi:fumarate reductase flavoprotein subunit
VTDLHSQDADGEVLTADVVVVGGGGAGLAAAVAAARRGVRTVLLEKGAQLGGSTRLSVGSLSAAGTRLQRRAGIADDADAFRADMDAFVGDLVSRDNPTLRAVLAAEASVTLQWLEDLGVVFAGPFPEPPNRVSRMHTVIPGSGMYITKLARAAERAGATLHCAVAVDGLLANESGRVVGVKYRRGDRPYRLRASRGVILATGDFSGDAALRARFLSAAASAAIPINPTNTGDGHQLARAVGAALCNMDVIYGPQLRFPRAPRRGLVDRLPPWSWLARLGALFLTRAPSVLLKPLVTSLLIAHMSPVDRLFQEGAILVDREGCRLDGTPPAAALTSARESTGFIVLDARIAERFRRYPYFISTASGIAYAYFDDYAWGRPDLVHRGETPEALAAVIGAQPDRLQAAVEKLSGRPLFAMGPVQAMLTVTEGGLAVDGSCRVLGENGSVVPGLYAAGSAAQGGMLLKGHGLHIAWAMTSGRIAGAMAARQLPVPLGEALGDVCISEGRHEARAT